MRILSRQQGADLLGISSSLLCLIHCLIFPVLLVVGNFSDHWHRWDSIDYLFILMAGVAVYFSTRHLNSTLVRRGLWVSWLCFSIAIVLHDQYSLALYASALSSVSLTLFHMASYREKHA